MDENNTKSILKKKNEGFDPNKRSTRAAEKNQVWENVPKKDPKKKVSWKPELVEIFKFENDPEERGNVAKDVFMK
jgi:hypothetical protein